jgi:predicted nucleic acid-binding protein
MQARQSLAPLLVPTPVAGEAYTKLRYDKRVSSRRDAGVALAVFKMIDASPDAFRLVEPPPGMHADAVRVLTRYSDQRFSYVDALIFAMVDGDATVGSVLTVDGRDFSTYQFTHPINVITP